MPLPGSDYVYTVAFTVNPYKYHYRYSTVSWSIIIVGMSEILHLTQYITNAGISRAIGIYTITHFKHHHRVLWLISNRMSIGTGRAV